jgi:hypothetical protein
MVWNKPGRQAAVEEAADEEQFSSPSTAPAGSRQKTNSNAGQAMVHNVCLSAAVAQVGSLMTHW